MYVGNLKPHKNLERLLEAYSKIKSLDKTNLILVGKAFEKYDYLGKGARLINSAEFTGLTVEEAKVQITDKLVKMGVARKKNHLPNCVAGRPS